MKDGEETNFQLLRGNLAFPPRVAAVRSRGRATDWEDAARGAAVRASGEASTVSARAAGLGPRTGVPAPGRRAPRGSQRPLSRPVPTRESGRLRSRESGVRAPLPLAGSLARSRVRERERARGGGRSRPPRCRRHYPLFPRCTDVADRRARLAPGCGLQIGVSI